jgi:hypothetical protein
MTTFADESGVEFADESGVVFRDENVEYGFTVPGTSTLSINWVRQQLHSLSIDSVSTITVVEFGTGFFFTFNVAGTSAIQPSMVVERDFSFDVAATSALQFALIVDKEFGWSVNAQSVSSVGLNVDRSLGFTLAGESEVNAILAIEIGFAFVVTGTSEIDMLIRLIFEDISPTTSLTYTDKQPSVSGGFYTDKVS